MKITLYDIIVYYKVLYSIILICMISYYALPQKGPCQAKVSTSAAAKASVSEQTTTGTSSRQALEVWKELKVFEVHSSSFWGLGYSNIV